MDYNAILKCSMISDRLDVDKMFDENEQILIINDIEIVIKISLLLKNWCCNYIKFNIV